MNKKELYNIISQGENEQLEFKEIFNKQVSFLWAGHSKYTTSTELGNEKNLDKMNFRYDLVYVMENDA